MRIKLIAILCLLVQAAAIAREPAVPLAVYGRLPFLEDVTLSPDGSRMAMVRTQGEVRNLLVLPVGGPIKLLAGARLGTTKLRRVQWEDNDNLLVTISSTGSPPIGFSGPVREWYQLVRLNIPSGRLQPFNFKVRETNTFNVVIGSPQVRQVDGRTVTYVPGLWVGSYETLPGLFAFNGQQAKLVARGEQRSVQWLVDANGKIASDLSYDADRKTWQLRAREDKGLTMVAKGQADIDSPDLLGFTQEGAGVVVEFTEDGQSVWRPVSLSTGKVGEPLDGAYALHSVFTDSSTGRIIGGMRDSGHDQVVFFDKALQSHWDAMRIDFPDEIVRLISHSDDFSRLLVEVFGAKDGYSLALYDWRVRKPYMIGSRYEGLTETAAVESVSYEAGDGLKIPGFLTVRRDLARKNLPLVVFPHGGPAAHDVEGFNWWAQAIAEQGYAVLQPNFRGSSLSDEWVAKGYGEWGRKMQTDLSDGVAYLAKEGIVDPKRVCIVGASYGGYAALAGVTLQSGIYRCSVSVAGVADLVRMRSWTHRNESSSATRYWNRFWGVDDRDDSGLRVYSPIEHLEQMNAPLLLIHGKDDTVVPYEQSERMASALRKAGKPAEFVTMQHEDHWLSRGETRSQMLEATVAFLRQHNPPD